MVGVLYVLRKLVKIVYDDIGDHAPLVFHLRGESVVSGLVGKDDEPVAFFIGFEPERTDRVAAFAQIGLQFVVFV